MTTTRTPMQEMTDREFVELLRRRDIQLSSRSGKLQINAPAGAVNPAIRDELSRRKPSLLLYLDVDDAISAGSSAAEPAPLTYAQQRLWLIDGFHPGSIAYNIPEAFRIDGPFELDCMRRAVHSLVQRHEILRMHVEVVNGVPVQQCGTDVEIPVEFTDLEDSDAALQDARLHGAIRDAASKSFDLRRGPLVRVHVFRLHAESHVVLVNLHHIIADGWSLRILLREITQLYLSAVAGEASRLPALPIQYADYARWERRQILTGAMQQQAEYWMWKLKDAPPLLELPVAHPRPLAASFEGAVERCRVSRPLTAALKRLAQAENASLFMTLLAAFSVLLHRYTGEEDMCIGSPISGRGRVETEGLIGLFVNLLVLRCEPKAKLSFRELLRSIRTTALEAYENSNVPFQKLVADLHPERTPGVSPLFQVLFALDAHMPEAAVGPVQIDAYPSVAKFDLTLQLAEHDEQVSGVFEYRTDLFEAADIARMARHFGILLESIAANPDCRIDELNLLPEDERETLLSAWNQTKMNFADELTVKEIFERQAKLSPDATAVVFGTDTVTYRELNIRANRIAHSLAAAGAAPEMLAGICMERSIDMIAALLGVLKSGAAYVPLDPHYPEQRLAFMLQDSGAKTVVTDSNSLARISQFKGEVLCMDRDRDRIDKMPQHDPERVLSNANAAYVIYTSGSTGQPKGVVIEHRNVASFLHWAQSVFQPDALRGVLAATSICFDLSVFEIFLPLCFGHTVILAADILELVQLPAASRVTMVNTVPSAIAALLKVGRLPGAVRVVNTAGEFLAAPVVDEIYSTGHVTHVYDLYGPTETTTYSTFALRKANAKATIGRPIANTRIYLLDANLQPVPTGVPGELFIAGDGVARGYLNRPGLTAERFISLAHLGETGRAYRTGDLARYLDDGNLAYAGRIDHQVKLRGHRIELGEIESVLREYAGIDEAAVLMVKNATASASAGEHLAAYVTLRGVKRQLDTNEVASFLRKRLPAYMAVSHIEVLDKLPHTPNGKLDRNALAAIPARTAAGMGARETRKARNEEERLLTGIWERCFERSPIGIDEDFFEIGGHSLLAFQVFAEIESLTGKRLMLATLFEAPTIEKLARLMRQS